MFHLHKLSKSNHLKTILDYKFLAVVSLMFCLETSNFPNSVYENLPKSSLFGGAHSFFISNTFFNSTSVLLIFLMNSASDFA